jgi:hypothetical protein
MFSSRAHSASNHLKNWLRCKENRTGAFYVALAMRTPANEGPNPVGHAITQEDTECVKCCDSLPVRKTGGAAIAAPPLKMNRFSKPCL